MQLETGTAEWNNLDECLDERWHSVMCYDSLLPSNYDCFSDTEGCDSIEVSFEIRLKQNANENIVFPFLDQIGSRSGSDQGSTEQACFDARYDTTVLLFFRLPLYFPSYFVFIHPHKQFLWDLCADNECRPADYCPGDVVGH